jgi:putative phosphoesterase
MKIGILSDTHNNQINLQLALDIFRNAGVTKLIHCGDMTNAQTTVLLNGFSVIHVAGNMDGNPGSIRRTLLKLNPDNSSGPYFKGQLDGQWIAATHSHVPGQLDAFIQDGRFAYVFHGHTHRRHDVRVGQTRIINPGALGGTRHEDRSICLVDLASGEVRFLRVAGR